VVIAAVAGTVAFLVAYAATSGGNGKGEFAGQVEETPSDPSKGQPYQGGPRLYAPIQTIDLGQVPFNTVVSKSFDLKNVGDATLKIQDVQVKMLEGC
jgi:hypothetical protein